MKSLQHGGTMVHPVRTETNVPLLPEGVRMEGNVCLLHCWVIWGARDAIFPHCTVAVWVSDCYRIRSDKPIIAPFVDIWVGSAWVCFFCVLFCAAQTIALS